jgi:hypothetical protein
MTRGRGGAVAWGTLVRSCGLAAALASAGIGAEPAEPYKQVDGSYEFPDEMLLGIASKYEKGFHECPPAGQPTTCGHAQNL